MKNLIEILDALEKARKYNKHGIPRKSEFDEYEAFMVLIKEFQEQHEKIKSLITWFLDVEKRMDKIEKSMIEHTIEHVDLANKLLSK